MAGYRELFAEAGNALLEARTLMEAWEGKEAPADIQTQIDRLLDVAQEKSAAGTALEKRADRVSALEATLHSPDESRRLPVPGAGDAAETKAKADGPLLLGRPGREIVVKQPSSPQELRAFSRALSAGGLGLLGPEDRKDLQTTTGPSGGYLVAPQQWVAEVLIFVNDQVFIRNLSTTYTVEGAESLGRPSLEVDPADADWTGEVIAASADTALAFGQRELKPSPLSKLVKISRPLIAKVANVDGLVQQRLAYKFAITEEKAFLVGTGANQPLGVFTPSAQGVDTGRDQAAASATVIAFDDLINLQFKLKAAYWKNAQWIMNRTVVKAVRALKDGLGQYIWQPATMPGVPTTILQMPLNISEYAPGTIATGQYVVALGDFSFYWIADSLKFQVQMLDQLYALTNQNGYVARAEVDGMPALAEAFARLKMA